MKVRKERAHNSKFRNVLKHYFAFYNKNLKKNHIIVYVISLVIFALFMINFISNLSEVNQFLSELKSTQEKSNIFINVIKEKIPVVVLLLFSGITPFVYIPLVGVVGFPYILATEIMNMSLLNMIIACIGSVIQIFGVSLAISAGIYYCTCSSKKYRYSQSSSFGLDDVKAQIYEARKQEDMLNKLKEKKQAKLEKREKLNVKVEYRALFITAIISTVIVSVAAIITGV